MREILTDAHVRAECSIFQPYPEQLLLNDVSSQQALRFKPRSKMNMFLNSVSGSRPQTAIAQALASSGVKNTGVAEDLAARLRYVYERGEEPAALEATVASVVAQAQQEQADISRVRDASVNQGQPLDQIVAQQDAAVQTEVNTDEMTAMMEQLLLEHTEEQQLVESAKPTNDRMDPMDTLNTKTKKELLQLYARYRQGPQVPASHFRRAGVSRGEIIGAILEAKPDLTSEDIAAHSDLLHNAAALRQGLQNDQAADEHRTRIHSRLPRLPGSDRRRSAIPGDEADTEMDVSPTKIGGTVEIASSVDSSSTEYETAQEEVSTARTAAARFEERHHIPEWVNAFSVAASDLLRGERRSEGIARRAGTTRDQGDL
jgi:hypothetical protein